METNQPLDAGVTLNQLEISSRILTNLNETAGWAKFLAICGFIFLIILGSMGFIIELFISAYLPEDAQSEFPTGTMTAFYLFFAALYLLPVIYLYRFSTKTKLALKHRTQQQLEEAFANIKAHYKFIGILMIIFLGLNVLSITALLFLGLPLD